MGSLGLCAATLGTLGTASADPTVSRLTPPSALFSFGDTTPPIIARFFAGQRFDLAEIPCTQSILRHVLQLIIELPEYYVVWYNNKGFPKGELGQQLQLVYELKLNGLEDLIRNIKKKYPKPI